MLRPTKHSHPDQTVINVSLLILQRLRKLRIDKFDSLRNFIKGFVNGGDILFLPAINFLYLFGLIEYHKKTDSFEYENPNEIIETIH
jgi:hypothetical protein